MAKAKTRPQRYPPIFVGIYLLAIGFFILKFLSFNHPEAGFAWLPQYGQAFHEAKTEEFKNAKHLVTSEFGYDGQFYSQMALSPTLQQEGLENAMDSFSYRSRRILFSWTAFALGLGNPDWIVQAYSAQNALFWLLLAALLLHWFPPTGWQNAIRYVGTLFTPGLIISVTHALLDGPSLFLVALGAYFIEKNKRVTGCVALALSGLGKETNILSAALIPLPENAKPATLLRYLKRSVAIAIPLGFWILYVSTLTQNAGGSAGSRNFSYPFASWLSSLTDNLASLFQTV